MLIKKKNNKIVYIFVENQNFREKTIKKYLNKLKFKVVIIYNKENCVSKENKIGSIHLDKTNFLKFFFKINSIKILHANEALNAFYYIFFGKKTILSLYDLSLRPEVDIFTKLIEKKIFSLCNYTIERDFRFRIHYKKIYKQNRIISSLLPDTSNLKYAENYNNRENFISIGYFDNSMDKMFNAEKKILENKKKLFILTSKNNYENFYTLKAILSSKKIDISNLILITNKTEDNLRSIFNSVKYGICPHDNVQRHNKNYLTYCPSARVNDYIENKFTIIINFRLKYQLLMIKNSKTPIINYDEFINEKFNIKDIDKITNRIFKHDKNFLRESKILLSLRNLINKIK
jgi:hypothetical protein